MSEPTKWLPWALDHLQGWKRLVSVMANVLVVLALAQLAGVDIAALSNGNVSPPVPWYGTLALACLAIGVESRISNEQEARLRRNVGTVPPSRPQA